MHIVLVEVTGFGVSEYSFVIPEVGMSGLVALYNMAAPVCTRQC